MPRTGADEVEVLDKRGMNGPTTRRRDLLDGQLGAEHHKVVLLGIICNTLVTYRKIRVAREATHGEHDILGGPAVSSIAARPA
jgi:hypothetical protein